MNQPLAHVPQGGRSLAQMIANLGPQSALAAQSPVDPAALAAGIKASFATLTFKGKTWGIRHRGVSHQLLVRDPNTGQVLGSVPTVDIVILKSATAISKSFYIEKYKEGDFNQPDCWSTNGVAPDMAAPKRQSETCRGCRWDAFGSRTMDDGRKGKACSDNKRLAVVPAADLRNEVYGGPMLLKLPPSGFAGLSQLEAELQQAGYHYYAIIMRLSFDHTVAFPKIIFTPIGVLNDYQMQEVINLQQLDVVDRILSEELYEVSADPNQPTAEQTAPTGIQQGHAAQTVQPQPVAAQPQPVQAFAPVAPVQQPVPQTPAVTTGFVAQPMTAAQPIQQHVQPAPLQGNDPGPIPAHLNRLPDPAPNVGTQPQVSTNGNAEAAETPEQRIARLEAALAAATAKPARRSTKRTQPVTPAGNQPQVQVQPLTQQPQPLAGPALPLTGAQPTPPNGAEQRISAEMQGVAGQAIVPPGDDEGDVPADLASRVDKLLNAPS
jgi:hypothetical protein